MPLRARHAIGTGFRMTLACALFFCALLLVARHRIASVYASDPQVVALAAGLLAWLALYHLGDATQAVCVFVLRCYRVAVAPLVAYCVLLWGAGLAGGYVLAYRGIGPLPAMQSPAAFWIASALALLVLALVLPVILWRAVRSWPVAASSARSRPGGKRIVKVEPAPGVLSISSSAPWRCTTCLTIARPSPVPPVSRERLRSTR